MFGERDPFEDEISQLLDLYELEDIFELLGLTPYEILDILLTNGHASLPEWTNSYIGDQEDDTNFDE